METHKVNIADLDLSAGSVELAFAVVFSDPPAIVNLRDSDLKNKIEEVSHGNAG